MAARERLPGNLFPGHSQPFSRHCGKARDGMKRRVVITGLGVISAIGSGKDAFWQGLLAGTSGETLLSDVTCCSLFEHHSFDAQVVCEVKDFDPLAQGVPADCLEMDRSIQFAVAGAHQAMQDAQLAELDDCERAGVVLATAICGTQTLDKEFTKVTDMGSHPIRSAGASPHLYAAAMGNSAALEIAARYGFQGETVTLSTGCIGGVDAISYAYESVAGGEHDIVIAGAAEAPITPITIAAFDIIHCLSHHNSKASRPFCASRDGFVLSEGCGIVVLEELEHARARQAPIYAEITGWAVTEHAMHMTDMSPEGRDLVRAITDTIDRAETLPTQIDFINAHGTSTPQNDIRETQAIKAVLGSHASTIPVNSTKSMLGHSLAAASALEVVACALSLQHQTLHPTINYLDPDPACDLDYVPNVPRRYDMEQLITTASGFSGLHAALAIRSVKDDRRTL
ncbi:MAG TPA: beta-ketoacyl-[acyl-carrier-protein] synthase family protein [Ktedonobacteraceae bacterium]|nr:beta-ketoacyl-[acyl-carrier-protein] synthase family protein [Ktedonobacteraceae bacterium]